MERKFDSKTQRTERNEFKGKNFSKNTFKGNRGNDRKSSNKTVIKKSKFLIGPMLPSPKGVLVSILLKKYRENSYYNNDEFVQENKNIVNYVFENNVNIEFKFLETLSHEKNCIVRDSHYKNIFYNLTSLVLTKEMEQLHKWAPNYIKNIDTIAELFNRNEVSKPLADKISEFSSTIKYIMKKSKIEGTDKEAIKTAMANINIDDIDLSNLGYIQKDLVEKFKLYMDNTISFTSIHIGLPNYSNCVIFFDTPISDDIITALSTDFRKILFVNMFNFKLFNTDNIAIINKPIVDVMLTEGETEYTKLSDPALLKKPLYNKKKEGFKNNKFGGKNNGFTKRTKEFSKCNN